MDLETLASLRIKTSAIEKKIPATGRKAPSPLYLGYEPTPQDTKDLLLEHRRRILRRAPGGMLDMPMPDYIMPTTTNPILAGLQFGLLGGAGGIGYSMLKDNLRKKVMAGNYGAVAKPVLIGALIGSVLGVIGANNANKTGPRPPAKTWEEYSRRIGERARSSAPTLFGDTPDVTPYRGMRTVPYGGPYPNTWGMRKQQSAEMEKRGFVVTGALLMTGLSAVMGAWGAYEAVQDTRKAITAAKAGNKSKAWRHGGMAVLDSLLAMPVVGWFGRGARGVLTGTRLAKAVDKGAKGSKAIQKLMAAGKAAQGAKATAAKGLGLAGRAVKTTAKKVPGVTRGLGAAKGVAAKVPGATKGLRAAGRAAKSKQMWGGAGYGFGYGLLDPEYSQQQQIAQRNPYRPGQAGPAQSGNNPMLDYIAGIGAKKHPMPQLTMENVFGDTQRGIWGGA